MPSYEYECQLCKARVELVQSLEKHEAPSVCPSCNMEHTMTRVNIPSSFIPVAEVSNQPAMSDESGKE